MQPKPEGFPDCVELNPFICEIERHGVKIPSGFASIKTLEGMMIASPGDYIIRGVNGEFYPCKPDIFEKTYDAI